MNKKIRLLILILCSIIFAVSVFKIIYYAKDYVKGRNDYQTASELFEIPQNKDLKNINVPPKGEVIKPQNPITEYFKDCDFNALYAINEEIVGWIVIPNTNISYPICQHDDNDFYLAHTYDLEENRIGSIFLDYRVSSDFSDFNTIIFGHRLKDKTMFSALKTFRDKATWDENPYIYICTPESIFVYTIYAAYSGDPDGLSYAKNVTEDEDKQEFIDYTLRCAEYDTGIVPDITDQMITLSTCIGSNHTHRMIINAVLTQTINR